MQHKDSKKKLKEQQEIIKKIVAYRRTMRDLEQKIDSEILEHEEVEKIREQIGKLRIVVSNIENNTFRNIDKGIYLGLSINLLESTDNEIKPSYLAWEKITNHVGVLGASGVGKTILMLSNIKDTINKGWSSVIVDPKGGNGQEIVNATLSFAKDKGVLNNTYYLSPAIPENSFLINPIFGMSNVEVATSARDLIMTERTEDFYGNITYKTVMAILSSFQFLEAVLDPTGEIAISEIDMENKKHERLMNLNNFSKRFDKNNEEPEDGIVANINDFDAILLEATENVTAKRSLVTYRDLAEYVSHQELTNLKMEVEQVLIPDDMPNRKKLEKLKREALFLMDDTLKQEKDFFSKVSTSLSTLLTKLSAGEVGDIFCTIRTNPLITKLGKKDAEQFILIVQPFSIRFGDIANTVVKLILKQLATLFGNVGSTERIINRVVMFLDEGGDVLYSDISDLFNKVRSLGGTIMIYTQSYQDFIDALGETRGKRVIDNINTTVRLRVNDIESAERVVKELSTAVEFGSTTVASTGTNDSRVIIQKKEEDILNPTDVTLMPVGRGIVKYSGSIYLVDFAHYGKIYSSIKFSTNKYFKEIDRQNLAS